MGEKNQKTVLVATSGGVDSSVAAALLKKQGYKVAGVFMHFWSEADASATQIKTDGKTDSHRLENKCCSAEAERIARRVAAKLDIPFYVMNFEKEFKKAVVDYFLAEFAQGRTPNPCVVCNREIKFGLLFGKAQGLGMDHVATGHYAKIGTNYLKKNPRGEKFKLFRAKDKTKDQSYFLWTLGQKQLSRILFPLGDYTKKEVYELAKKWELPYRKTESFDICFIAGKDHKEFLKKYLQPKPGPIVDTSGMVVGQHDGLPLYTVGQRKDIRIGAAGPYYVIGGDLKTNTLFVTNKPYDRQLYKKNLIAEEVNWVSGVEPRLPLSCQVKIRYGHKAVPAVVRNYESGIMSQVLVEFKDAQRAVTPGQSVVFYQRNEVLGGGVIK